MPDESRVRRGEPPSTPKPPATRRSTSTPTCARRDADTEDLPESFRIKLRRALAHYGVTDLDVVTRPGALRSTGCSWPTAARATHVPVVSDLLQWRLRDPDSLPEDARDGYRQVLDQLVSATQLRHPVIGDLARQVRYRCFDAPLIAASAPGCSSRCACELDRLSADPEARAAADRRHRRLRRADPRRVRRAAPRRDARGDDPAVLRLIGRCRTSGSPSTTAARVLTARVRPRRPGRHRGGHRRPWRSEIDSAPPSRPTCTSWSTRSRADPPC